MPVSIVPQAAPAAPFGAMAGTLRQEMAIWAEPIVSDRIVDAYRDCDLSPPLMSLLAIHHRRLWRARILDQRTTAEQVWLELERDLVRAGLDPEISDEIDALVMDELMEIVFARYRNSRDKAMGFGRVLLAAAAQSGRARPYAA